MSFEIYARGPIYCSVCTDIANVDEITDKVNLQNPTGISSKWRLAKEPFNDGTANPHACEQSSNKKHYLFTC